LAFLAMVCHQLGQSSEAANHLQRLRERMQDPLASQSSDNKAALQEAEALLQSP
jgi:hypothetical protein